MRPLFNTVTRSRCYKPRGRLGEIGRASHAPRVHVTAASPRRRRRRLSNNEMVFRVWPDVEAALGGPERDALLAFRSTLAPQETDPVTALRFLRARDLNIAKASAMHAEYLAWRTVERVDDVLTEAIDPTVRLRPPARAQDAPVPQMTFPSAAGRSCSG